jgi:tetratricopeptide (TPR) repeat protein
MTAPRALARLALVALALVLAGGSARAGDRSHEDVATRDAKRHFKQGEKLFALGRFDAALSEYEAAFDARPLPAFLFNIGQCHRNLHQYDAAIFSFRKYLRLAPDASNRAAVEDLIRDLEHRQAVERARADQRETDRARAARHHPGHRPLYKKWWVWTTVGVVAAGTTGAILLSRGGGVPSTDLGNVEFP